MAGRSIEDILRQQAAQRQAQIQQQQAQERALYEQRERARQDYLERARMYEKLASINPSAAASAAAGAGGSGNRVIPTINGHVEFILFTTSDSDNYQYVILDFLAETISEVKDMGIPYSSNYDYYMVENTGWVFEFDNGTTLFINDNAEIVETISNEDQYSSWNKRTFYFAYFTDGTIKYFDGKEVTTYTGLPSSSIISSTYFTKNLVFVFATDDTTNATVYTWTKDGGLTECWTGTSGTSTERYNGVWANEGSDFFTVAQFNDTLDTWKTIHIFGENGLEKTSLDLSSVYSVAKVNSGYATFFGDNKLEWKFTGPTASYSFNIYDGDTDTWRQSSHAKTNYTNDSILYQEHWDGSQFTSLSNGIVHVLYSTGSTSSVYNIDKYNYVDVVWSVDGSTHSTYVINNTGTSTKGVDINDADRYDTNSSLYIGKSIFLPMWLNDSTFRLLCLTGTQSVNIAVGSTTNLTGSQGSGIIPGWNTNQRYASFRVGDYFGVWLAYSTSDAYKIYDYTGNLALSFTMSTGTRLNYSGDVAVITDSTAGIEYYINSNNIGLSPSYATQSYSEMTYYGLKPQFPDGDTTPSKLLSYNEGGFALSRMYTDEDVYEFTMGEDTIFYRYLSDQYVVLVGSTGTNNWQIYFYDWTATLLAKVDSGISYGTSFNAELIKDRLYFKVTDGSTDTFYYFSPTKSDSISIDNISGHDTFYDNWAWWVG